MLPSSYIDHLPPRLQKKIVAKHSSLKLENDRGHGSAAAANAASPKDREVRTQMRSSNIPGVFTITPVEKKVEGKPPHSDVSSTKCPAPSWVSNCPSKSDHLIHQVKELNCEMECLLKSGLKDWERLFKLSENFKEIFKSLLDSQLLYCWKQGVDNYFWKILYYNNIQYLKNRINRTQNLALKEKVEELIMDGIEFYQRMYSMIHEHYLEEPKEKLLTVAKVIAQKMLINVGNLHRYKTLMSGEGNFELSAVYYMKAQEILPANGVPFNQMAIISIYNRKTFDAVYYHVRSLMSSNSIQSANESLQEIFDKIRRKEAELKSENFTTDDKSKKQTDEINKFRTEEWIYPTNEEVETKNTLDMDNKSSSEILKRFYLIYLNLIGMVFTGIWVDDFEENLQLAITLFSYLLKNHQSFSRNELFQILTINIFSVEYKKESGSRKEIFKKATHLSTSFLIVILETYLNISDDKDINSKKYLQFLYIFSNWMWDKPYYEQYFLNSLSNSSNFNVLIKKTIKCLSSKVGNDINIIVPKRLSENEFFCGFKPVTEWSSKETINDFSENDYRLKTISTFLIKLDSFYNGILESNNKERGDSVLSSLSALKLENKAEVDTYKPSEESEHVDEEIVKLSKRKEELERKSKLDQICRDKFQEILKKVNVKVHIEIQPKYLVPDTNCFIDSLDELQIIANDFENYFLVVPLIVVKELDGLSRGFKASSTSSSLKKKNIHHFDEVSTLAKKSIEFIQNSSHVKCATTKGSILSSSMFSLEEDESLSNDDKILSTAIALQNQSKTEKILQDKYFLKTEILLLTTDRNLRVKALTRNLVVRELKEFIKWAKKS